MHASAVQETVLTPPDLESADFRLFDRWCDATQEGGVTVVPYERLVLGTDNQPVAILRMNVRESLLRSLYREYEPDGVRGFYIVNPVYYTHLDVYKRQVLRSSSTNSMIRGYL